MHNCYVRTVQMTCIHIGQLSQLAPLVNYLPHYELYLLEEKWRECLSFTESYLMEVHKTRQTKTSCKPFLNVWQPFRSTRSYFVKLCPVHTYAGLLYSLYKNIVTVTKIYQKLLEVSITMNTRITSATPFNSLEKLLMICMFHHSLIPMCTLCCTKPCFHDCTYKEGYSHLRNQAIIGRYTCNGECDGVLPSSVPHVCTFNNIQHERSIFFF